MKLNGNQVPGIAVGNRTRFSTGILLLMTLSLFCLSGVAVGQGAMSAAEVDAQLAAGQITFATPEEAADAFHEAVKNSDGEKMAKVLGTDYRAVLHLDEVDEQDVTNFLVAWDKYHGLLPEGEGKMILAVGEGGWTMPLPIVSGSEGWHFDINEGLERMLIRAIGRNELSTMQAVMAYYDAQFEYAEADRNGDGMLEYAQKIVSTPGNRDGLYWEVAPGEPQSPLGPLMGDRTPGGGYHGYHYRILTAQGKHAEDGARSYLMGDRMRSGFALVAWPIVYGETGVMTFIVSHDGTVYERDLGPETENLATEIKAFDPDENWNPVKELQGS